jgi:hypothetical protein
MLLLHVQVEFEFEIKSKGNAREREDEKSDCNFMQISRRENIKCNRDYGFLLPQPITPEKKWNKNKIKWKKSSIKCDERETPHHYSRFIVAISNKSVKSLSFS